MKQFIKFLITIDCSKKMSCRMSSYTIACLWVQVLMIRIVLLGENLKKRTGAIGTAENKKKS